jgi:putative transposase
MGRAKRADDGGMVFHVLNRANARATIFEKPEDYLAFERVLQEALDRVEMRVLSYCLMPNHWHLVLWPRRDGDLSKFMGWLTLTHTQRWHAHHHTVGTGHLYQGRFKSFPVQSDAELAALRRSVNRGSPFGESGWTKRIVKRLGLEVTIRPRGRPKLASGENNGS